ncbi:MAG: hypothetical protein DBX55_09615 [Verrucomicrobia bacterium]|nr:MAG: hypothetical protein DBX55_09615 [Verrucomicrobiota bacterium]
MFEKDNIRAAIFGRKVRHLGETFLSSRLSKFARKRELADSPSGLARGNLCSLYGEIFALSH